MARIEWAVWANEQGVISCGILFVGGLLSVCSLAQDKSHVRWEIGAYGMAIAALVLLLEYPRSKRQKGNTRQRDYQHIPTSLVASMGFFGRNYFVRFIMYLLFCLPCLFQLGTIMGGLCLLVTACIYLCAAACGENWQPYKNISPIQNPVTIPPPPTTAPPRVASSSNNAKMNEAYTEDENAANVRV